MTSHLSVSVFIFYCWINYAQHIKQFNNCLLLVSQLTCQLFNQSLMRFCCYATRNVQNNQFTGWIPNKLKSINNLKWVGLCFFFGCFFGFCGFSALLSIFCWLFSEGLEEILGQLENHLQVWLQLEIIMAKATKAQLKMPNITKLKKENNIQTWKVQSLLWYW